MPTLGQAFPCRSDSEQGGLLQHIEAVPQQFEKLMLIDQPIDSHLTFRDLVQMSLFLQMNLFTGLQPEV